MSHLTPTKEERKKGGGRRGRRETSLQSGMYSEGSSVKVDNEHVIENRDSESC